jgi:undecaprenyl-diphosphatase
MDYRLEQWINGPAGQHPALDTVMRDAASWGQWLFGGIVVAWMLYAWLRGGAADRRGALTALFGAGIALGINQVISSVWNRPRPFVAHSDTVHVLLAYSRDASFPSDHAAAGFAIATALLIVHRRWGVAALAAAAIMSYARVFVGVHYPGDVLAGALIGIAVGWALMRWGRPPIAAIQAWLERGAGALHLPIPRTP